ncbi:MAG TPA: prepilin-type N-terminal cleavage/methylation domain-containing protein [Armatimonadota bacterium]|jgi:prepilin-type N-terminal cleavage/methylation domain-containing protein
MVQNYDNRYNRSWFDRRHTACGRGRRTGVSLVELLVATVILGIGLVALMQLYMAALWSYQKGRYLSLATQRAQLEYEKVQNLGFYGLDNGPTDFTYLRTSSGGEYTWLNPGPGVTFAVSALPGGSGTVTWQHFPANATGNSNMVKVDIRISWTGSVKTRSDVRLVTLLANK